MKRLLVLAGLVAGTVAPYLPAQAHPHDHLCAGMTDTNCVRDDGWLCDQWYEVPDAASVCLHWPHFEGGCSFGTNGDPTGQILNPDTQTGVINGTAIGFDHPVTGTNPATTSIECWVEVNGIRQTLCETSGTGTPIATPSDTCQYDPPAGSIVRLCQTVIVNGATLSGPGECFHDGGDFEFPPREVRDLLCPILAGLGPIGAPPALGIDADGSVRIAGIEVIECW